MRWLVLVAVACSTPGKPEPERAPEQPTAAPSDEQAMPLEPVGGGAAGAGAPASAVGGEGGEDALVAGATLHAIAGATNGQFAITADSRWIVYGDGRGLRSVRVDGLVDRVIAARAGALFRLTADSKYVVYGKRLARVPIEGGEEVAIAPKLQVAELGDFVVSPDGKWVAFTEAAGDLAIASLADGAARKLPIKRPRDGRHHFGSGHVKKFSGDSTHLVFQHGATYEVIGVDGRGRRGITRAAQGIEVVGSDLAIAVGEREVRVVPLDGAAGATIATPPLLGFSGPAIAPDARGLAFVAVDYRLHYIDLETRTLRAISPGGVRASSFVEHTPDSTQVLYVDMGPEGQRSCTVRAFDLATARDRILARLPSGEQCFVKPAGNRRAVIHAWHRTGDGIRRNFLLVDLGGGPVRRLVPTLEGAGNFDVSPDGGFVVFDGPGDARPLSLIRLP
jgi:hypothetical protein